MSNAVDVDGFRLAPKYLKVIQRSPNNKSSETDSWCYESKGGLEVYVKIGDTTISIKIPVQTMDAYLNRYRKSKNKY